MLKKLKEINKNIEILNINNDSFKLYGTIHNNIKVPNMIDFVLNTEMTNNDLYVPKENVLSNMEEAKQFTLHSYGQVPCQVGYFNSYNNKLNALEYHKCSETLVVITDVVVLVSHISEIKDYKLDSSKVKAFYVPAGTVLELYSTTLHFAPCMATTKGVRQIVVLSENTNTPLDYPIEDKSGENKLLFEKNKWVIAHEEATDLISKGAYCGIVGDNITINPIQI